MSVPPEDAEGEEDGAAETGGDGEGPDPQMEVFEERLKEAIDGMTQKSSKGRVDSLVAIMQALRAKLIPDFIFERHMTLCDGVERGLKKGKGPEQGASADLLVLILIQLGLCPEAENIFRSIQPVLLTLMADSSASLLARAKVCTALGLVTFLAAEEKDETQASITTLAKVFSQAFLKGDGMPPAVTSEQGALYASALSAWALLITLLPATAVFALLDLHLPELLACPELEVRVTCGETLALCYEILRENDEEFELECHSALCSTLKELATDSSKFRAKKERKQQRSSFREILRTIQERESPCIRVRFGREVLELDSWRRRLQYDNLCTLLGSGMNLHLSQNELVRDIFNLGAPLPTNNLHAAHKVTKLERHLVHLAAFKARTVSRSKFRDKRSVVL
ncbi:unnamed protein product [Darwinula stevensoni]|uniref:Interferon-related developmental regulator 2 n=1 Tax=Darwinula stevensoni TaxID=69355 RepID=A0A7R9A5R0_9CRUS|nr:unnamed protein product [Darwinula stevensoni]CAG0885768.1 unnamed protein product [Darwinula stevensoni]